MKIKSRKSNLINEGDIREITKFASFPVRIGDDVRWLEKVGIKQEAVKFFDMSSGYSEIRWVDKEFIE